jgi:serine/threonine protein kinase
MTSLVPGSVLFDRFTLLRPLGAGGAAAVWLAAGGDGEVALKILHAERRRSAPAVERFRREADVLRSLEHPQIARFIELLVSEDLIGIALAYVEGRPLDQELAIRSADRRHYPDADALAILRSTAGAVGFAHARGILHRDIKPQNIIVSPSGATIVDFGIAKLFDTSFYDATTRGRRIGSILYSAPEQQTGEEVDARSDLFALASVTFEVLTLARAWARGPNDAMVPAFSGHLDPAINALPVVIERIAGSQRPRISALRPDLPAELDGVFARAMAAAAQDRQASVESFLEEVEGTLGARATRIVEPPEPTITRTAEVERPTEILPRRGARSIPVGAAAILGAGILYAALGGLEPSVVDRPSPPRIVPPAPVRVEPRAPDPVARAIERAIEPEGESAGEGEPALEAAGGRSAAPLGARRTEARVAPKKGRPPPPAIAEPSRLRSLLGELERRPSDPESLAALREAIMIEARALRDPKERASIERITASSALAGDVKGLALAVDRMERAKR